MNILYINHYAGSPKMGMEFRPYYLAKEWVKLGHDVTIIAGDYSHLRRENPKVYEDFQEEFIDGIKYLWVKTGSYAGNGVARAKTMFRFVHKLRKNAKRIVDSEKPDIVITSSTYPIDTFAGQKISKLAEAKLIHEVHDMWPSTLTTVGGMSKMNPFVVIMQIGENSAYKNSEYIVSLAPDAEPYMRNHGLKDGKFKHLPNGIIEDEWKSHVILSETHEKYINSIRAKQKYIIGYAGGHAISNDLEKILDIADLMRDDAVHFILVGDGAEKEKLITNARKLKLNNISFLPSISKEEIPALLKTFDFCILLAEENDLYREFGICMNKMFDYMASGKPTILGVDCKSSPIEEFACGVHIKSDSPKAVSDSIKKLLTMDEDELNAMGERGRNAAFNKFTYSKIAKKFEELF